MSILRAAENTESRRLLQAHDEQQLTYRTYAIRATDFKAGLEKRGLPPELCTRYRRANWPGFIWVVEALDQRRFSNGEPSGIGEAVIDSTATHVLSHERRSSWPARAVLAVRVPGKAVVARGPSLLDPEAFELPYEGTRRVAPATVEGRSEPEPWDLPLSDTADTFYPSGCPNGNW